VDKPQQPTMLGYATRGNGSSWRVRALIVLLVASNVYFAYDKWGGGVTDKLKFLWAQRACEHFEWCQKQVVFEGNPTRAAKLLAEGTYDALSSGDGTGTMLAASTAASNLYDGFGPSHAAAFPGGAYFGGSGGGIVVISQLREPRVLLFLHERRNPSGQPRIVAVTAEVSLPSQKVELTSELIQPGTYGTPADYVRPTTGDRFDSLQLQPCLVEDHPALRLFGGQIDPKDPTRFTIDYEDWYGISTIEGVVGSDDSITMRTIRGPGAKPE
jgi:hypothetical protein